MDYWTRIILATVIGLGAGLLIGQFFGDPLLWAFVCTAIAIATETTLRTMSNTAKSTPLNRPTGPLDQQASARPPRRPNRYRHFVSKRNVDNRAPK